MNNTKNNRINRRKFVKKTAIGAGGLILAPTILSSCAKAANNRIHIAHIGVGGRGGGEIKDYLLPLESTYSVATCDPHLKRRNGWANYINDHYNKKGVKAPNCKSYLDFEEILNRDDIDAVHINTPDHWHVPLAIKAARAGKHIWLAKPLGLSYPNYKILEKELVANDVRFHYGTQQRSMRHMQLGIEMIKNGEIGDIQRVEAWAPGKFPVQSPICNEVTVPGDFDFDRWTGPAPLNSYCPERVTNFSSWFQWDYSIGFLSGWGAHPLDIVVWGLKDKMDGVYSCEGTGGYWEPGGIYNNILSWDVNLTYDSGIQLSFVSYDVAKERDMLHYRANKEANGTTFFGNKGWISLSRGSAQSNIPELNKKLNDFPRDNKSKNLIDEGTMGQMFVDVVKGNSKETCPLDEAIISDCISHMSNIAIRTERKITWDPQLGKVVDDPEANKWFVREMRSPYTI